MERSFSLDIFDGRCNDRYWACNILSGCYCNCVQRKICKAGVQKSEPEGKQYDDRHKNQIDIDDGGRIDLLPMVQIPSTTRLVSLLGISSWFPRHYRRAVPAVSVVVVGVFVNAAALISGSIGLFTQLRIGFSYILNPDFDPKLAFGEGCMVVQMQTVAHTTHIFVILN